MDSLPTKIREELEALDRLADEFDKLARLLDYDIRAARFPSAELTAVELKEAA